MCMRMLLCVSGALMGEDVPQCVPLSLRSREQGPPARDTDTDLSSDSQGQGLGVHRCMGMVVIE